MYGVDGNVMLRAVREARRGPARTPVTFVLFVAGPAEVQKVVTSPPVCPIATPWSLMPG